VEVLVRPTSQIERRACKRFGLELPVHIEWKDVSGEVLESEGATKDMSASGAFVICQEMIGVKCHVNLKIDLPVTLAGARKSLVSARGSVVTKETMTEPDEGYGHRIKFDYFSFKRL
jgi:hypothetical protein